MHGFDYGKGVPASNNPKRSLTLVTNLLKVILSSRLALVKRAVHRGDTDSVSKGNVLAPNATKQTTLNSSSIGHFQSQNSKSKTKEYSE